MKRVLFIDDDQSFLRNISQSADETGGIIVFTLSDSFTIDKIRDSVDTNKINALVFDLRMHPGGLILMEEWKSEYGNDVDLILLTGKLVTKDENERIQNLKALTFHKSDGNINILVNVKNAIDKNMNSNNGPSAQMKYEAYNSMHIHLRPLIDEIIEEIKTMNDDEKTMLLSSSNTGDEFSNKGLMKSIDGFNEDAFELLEMKMNVLQKIVNIKKGKIRTKKLNK